MNDINKNTTNLNNGWRLAHIKDVAKVNENVIGKLYNDKIIEYIDIASVEKGFVNNLQALYLESAPSRAKRIIKDNDILISSVRPNLKHYAFIKKAKQNLIASTGFVVITAKTVEPRFLDYFLTTE